MEQRGANEKCMKEQNGKTVKNRSAHDDYELPEEVDFSKLRSVGRGLDALKRYATERHRTIVLATDVAEVFTSARQANDALRSLIRLAAESGRRRRK